MNIDNKASDFIQDDFNNESLNINGIEKNIESPEKQPSKILDFLKSKTGEGSIDSYQDHPLNYNNTNALGQIIRGFTGFFGSLDLAIVDISLGILRFMQDKKKVKIDV